MYSMMARLFATIRKSYPQSLVACLLEFEYYPQFSLRCFPTWWTKSSTTQVLWRFIFTKALDEVTILHSQGNFAKQLPHTWDNVVDNEAVLYLYTQYGEICLALSI
jgi:hypothetical protein